MIKLFNVPETNVLLNCKIEFGEALEDGGQMTMVVIRVIAPDVNTIDQKSALVKVGNSKQYLG